MLRGIPEKVLLAIVEKPDYGWAVLENHGALPESVFSYLNKVYGGLGLNSERLFARALTREQRSYALVSTSNPKFLEMFFACNVFTHEELSELDPKLISEDSGRSLLQRHRGDAVATRIITEIIPEAVVKELLSGYSTGRGAKRFLKGRSTGKDVATAVRSYLSLTESRGRADLTGEYPAFPVQSGLDMAWRMGSVREGVRGTPYSANSLVSLLGESPSTWLAFLAMLDTADANTPVIKVVETVRRVYLYKPLLVRYPLPA